MRVESVSLIEIFLPLKFRFETSFDVMENRRLLLLRVQTSAGEGVAECVAGEGAGYSHETPDTAWAILETVLVPRTLGREFHTPAQFGRLLRGVRGHQMAKAALECAVWDAYARSHELPLWQLLGGVRTEVPVGISIGIQPSVEETLLRVDEGVAQGYRRIKLKVKPGWDTKPVEAVRAKYPEIHLTVDANSAYTPADTRSLRRLDALGLDYIEQPLAHDDIHDHVALQKMLETPLCLDESIRSPADARKALASGAGRVINVKIGRIGGLADSVKVHDVSEAFSAPVWCGGMLETGVGRAFNLAISTLPNFIKPGDTASASRYWKKDIVCEALEAKEGLMKVPAGPGSGVTVDWDYVASVTVRSVDLS